MIAQEVYMNRKKDWWQLGISNIRNQKYHKNTAEESMKKWPMGRTNTQRQLQIKMFRGEISRKLYLMIFVGSWSEDQIWSIELSLGGQWH